MSLTIFYEAPEKKNKTKNTVHFENIKQTLKNMEIKISCVLPSQLQNTPLFQ